MPCSSCGSQKIAPSQATVRVASSSSSANPRQTSSTPLLAGRSTSQDLVKLRYYGGGMAAKRTTSGCKTCGGGRSTYQIVTTEQIMFVSDDAPNGIFKQTVSVGHDYYVTQEQAKVLLQMKARNAAGKLEPKFKEVK